MLRNFYAAMNPFHVEQFFLVKADWSIVFRVSTSIRHELVNLLRDQEVVYQDLSMSPHRAQSLHGDVLASPE